MGQNQAGVFIQGRMRCVKLVVGRMVDMGAGGGCLINFQIQCNSTVIILLPVVWKACGISQSQTRMVVYLHSYSPGNKVSQELESQALLA